MQFIAANMNTNTDLGQPPLRRAVASRLMRTLQGTEQLNVALRAYLESRIFHVFSKELRQIVDKYAVKSLMEAREAGDWGVYVAMLNSQNEAMMGWIVARLGIRHALMARQVEEIKHGRREPGALASLLFARGQQEEEEGGDGFAHKIQASLATAEMLYAALVNYLQSRIVKVGSEETRALLSEEALLHLGELRRQGDWMLYLTTLNNHLELMMGLVIVRLATRRLLAARGVEQRLF